MNTIIFTITQQIKNISILLNPIIPESSNKVLDTLNISVKDITLDEIKENKLLDHVNELKNLEILFNKIEDDN